MEHREAHERRDRGDLAVREARHFGDAIDEYEPDGEERVNAPLRQAIDDRLIHELPAVDLGAGR